MCMHNALGLFLFLRFTICKEGIPPLKSRAWYEAVMWPATARDKDNVTYKTQGALLKCAPENCHPVNGNGKWWQFC